MLNVSKFCNMLQYRCNFDTVRTRMANVYIIFLFIFLSPPITSLSLSLSLSLSHRPISPLFILFSLLSLSRSIFLRSAWRVWSSGDQHEWVMGLMFDFGVVGRGWATTTYGFCLPCVVGEICSPWVWVLPLWAWVC